MTTLRVLLHVAAHRDYKLHSLDFSTAFLQGSLHEEIWLRRPPGFTGTTLAALGFAPSTADPSLFLRTDTSLLPFYILVYVDDLVFATADTAGLAYVKSELQKRHTCTDLGELRSYLGLQITRDRARRTITLTQSHMVQQVLQRFGFTYSSPQATPLPTRHSLSTLPSDESCDRADGLSLFDLTSGLSPAPPATADSTVRSQWATRNAAARLAVHRHLPTTERAHFSQYRSAQTLYNAVVARYSSPATAALSRLFLPYLFPDLAAFPTVADLITHLRTSDARYRTALQSLVHAFLLRRFPSSPSPPHRALMSQHVPDS
ncbi:unnamed protein product [Closterium sp. NIES-53]